MIRLSRKIVVFIAITAFLLNAAGAFFYIHLGQHSHDCCEHDENHCSICQQAAVNKPQAVVLNDTVAVELPPVVYANICKSEVFIQNPDFRIPYLRAPPSVA
jgi:hypothetical protein